LPKISAKTQHKTLDSAWTKALFYKLKNQNGASHTEHIMKNFKSAVPATISAKIKAIADQFDFDDIVHSTARYGFFSEQRLDEIEGNYVSGWNPKQDGGFSINVLTQSDIDSSYHFTEKQTEWAKRQEEHCREAFCMDNGLDVETKWEDLGEELEEKYSEYEREFFEGALLEFQIFVDGYGEFLGWEKREEKTVLMRLSINYKDAPYFREGYAEDIKTWILTVEEFEKITYDEIVEHFTI
jgi:hypothetical protein